MPQFTVDRKLLAEELGVIQAAVEKKNTIPVLSFCLFEVSGDTAKITGTDLDVTIVTTVPVSDSDGDWSFCVPARQLYSLATLFDEGHVCFEATENERVRVRSGSSKHLLPTLKRDSFPDVEKLGKASVVIVPAPILRQMAKCSLLGMSTDVNEQKMWRRSLLLSAAKGVLEITGSNEKHLASTSIEILTQAEFSVLIPHRAANVLAGFCDAESDVQIQVSDNHAQFVIENRRMLARLAIDKFPAWRTFIPEETGDKARLVSSNLSLVVRRASVTSDERSYVQKPLIFEFGKRLQVESEESESGKSTESLSIDCPSMNGDTWRTKIHGTQILDFLKLANSEQVFCEFWKTPKVITKPANPKLGIEEQTFTHYHPLRFTPLDSPVNFQYFTMPLRD